MTVLPQPTYSPDLALIGFLLPTSLRTILFNINILGISGTNRTVLNDSMIAEKIFLHYGTFVYLKYVSKEENWFDRIINIYFKIIYFNLFSRPTP